MSCLWVVNCLAGLRSFELLCYLIWLQGCLVFVVISWGLFSYDLWVGWVCMGWISALFGVVEYYEFVCILVVYMLLVVMLKG